MINGEIGGIIYPLNDHNFNILKKREKPVYVKYPSRAGKHPTKLKQGHLLFFYLSRKDKSIIGYSKIKEVSIKTPQEVLQHYTRSMQMNDDEFNKYTIKRKDKKLLVLMLDDIVELEKNITIDYPITMAGKYISTDEMKRFTK